MHPSINGAFIYDQQLTEVSGYTNNGGYEEGGIYNLSAGTWASGSFADSYGATGTSHALRTESNHEQGVTVNYCAGTSTPTMSACPIPAAGAVAANNEAVADANVLSSRTTAAPETGVYGYTILESDTTTATLGSVTHSGYTPGTWTNQPFTDTVSLPASVNQQNGLGLGVAVIGTSSPPINTIPQQSTPAATANQPCSSGGSFPCVGLYPCPNGSYPCPYTGTTSLTYYSSQLPQGSTTLYAQATTAGGGSSVVSWPVDIDTTPPDVSLSPPPAATNGTITLSGTAIDPTPSGVNAVSGVNNVTLTATPASGASPITICTTTPTDAVGDYSCTWDTTQVSEDSYTITATATDNAGNVSTPATGSVIVDRTAPAMSLSGPLYDAEQSGQTVDAGTFSLNADAFDTPSNDGVLDSAGTDLTWSATPTSGVVSMTLLIDGAAQSGNTVTQTCTAGGCDLEHEFQINTADLSPGTHTLEVQATDAAGNVGTDEVTITVNPSITASPPSSASPAPSTPVASEDTAQSSAVSSLQNVAANLLDPWTSVADNLITYQPQIAQLLGQTNDFVTVGSSDGSSFDTTYGDGFSVMTSWGALQVTPQNVGQNAEQGVVTNSASLVYANVAPGVNAILRPTDLGMDADEEITNDSSPTSFSWSVTLDGGQHLQPLPDGSVAVLADLSDVVNETVPDDGTPAVLNGEPGAVSTDDLSDPLQDSYAASAQPSTSGDSSLLTNADNAAADLSATESEFSYAALQMSPSQDLVAMILPPAAVDAAGNAVPAALSVSGDTVTLNLEPSASTTYPVLADPEVVRCANIEPCQASTTTPPNTQWMQAYALKWVNGRNHNFVGFSGDDCTNFMSQILAAGGVDYQDYGSPNPDAWWVGYGFGPSNGGMEREAWHWSDSWSVAADFIHYMLRYHFAERITGDNWKVGDMIGYIWNNMPQQIDHVNFVAGTYVNGQGEVEPMVVQHSPNQDITTATFLHDSMAKQPDGSEEYPFQIVHIRFIRTAPLAPTN